MNFPKILTAASAILLASGTVAFALYGAGSQQDPLISLSYASDTYVNEVLKQIETQAKTELDTAQASLDNKLSEISSDEALEQKLVTQTAAALGLNTSTRASLTNSFSNGTKLQLAKTTEICLTSGSANIASGELINVTTGQMVSTGSVLIRNQLYLSPSANNVVELTSPAKVDISGNYTEISGTAPSYTAQYTMYADALNDLGLFSGSTNGYNLERSSTRTEGLVMLLRLLGEENRALNYKGSHPFTDVPGWADRYVAYAYEKGYTSGVSENLFGSQKTLTLNDYMTFLLRALEYNDKNGDFTWANSADAAIDAGILSQSEVQAIKDRNIFYRDDLVYTSYKVLFANCKNETFKLSDKLISSGIFTQTEFTLVQKNLS